MNTKLTPEQKQANKLIRAEDRKESKRIAKIEAEKNQLQVKEVIATFERMFNLFFLNIQTCR